MVPVIKPWFTKPETFRARPRIYALRARIMRAHTFKRAYETRAREVSPTPGPWGGVSLYWVSISQWGTVVGQWANRG